MYTRCCNLSSLHPAAGRRAQREDEQHGHTGAPTEARARETIRMEAAPPSCAAPAAADWAVSDDETAADAARREAIARDLCASGDEGGYAGGGRATVPAAGGRNAAAVCDWLQIIQVSELARNSFAERRTDEAELGRIRNRLAGPPRQCAEQLEELRDTYGLTTLGERCRFLAALDEFMVS